MVDPASLIGLWASQGDLVSRPSGKYRIEGIMKRLWLLLLLSLLMVRSALAQQCPTAQTYSSTTALSADYLACDPVCVPSGSGSYTVASIAQYIYTAAGNSECSVYTGTTTMTKVNAGCDTASTTLTTGWNTVNTTTASSCVVNGGTTYNVCCVYSSSSAYRGIPTSGPATSYYCNLGSYTLPSSQSGMTSDTSTYMYYTAAHN
jgi:hypothetical protein